MSVSVRARPGGPRQCPFCRDAAGEDVAPCACGVSYHPECRAELSRCVTIGCAGKSAAPGQRGAHRDVACVRCQGLIINDGDMCFECWSPLHRTCLAAGGCCRPAAKGWTPDQKVVAVLLLGPTIVCGSVGSVMTLNAHPEAIDPARFALAGAFVGALLGLAIGLVASFVFSVVSRERR